jgi:DNA polymerase-3 subunit epsilon
MEGYPVPNFEYSRAEASMWAANLMARQDWVILDTETTGLASTAEIIEVAIVDHTGRTVFDTLVKPKGCIDPAAHKVHGITCCMCENAPDWPLVAKILNKVVSAKTVIIYNIEFDTRLIGQTCKLYNMRFKGWNDAACAMKWYSQWVGEWNYHYGNYRWQRLRGGDHTALGDCKATFNLIKEMAKA